MLEIDDSDLEEFKESLELFEKNFPKETRQIMMKAGNKVRTIIRREARGTVSKDTGRYLKSIKRGKVFFDNSDTRVVRVYTSSKIAPHAHLIENGHRIVTHSGKEVGYQKGYHVFDKASTEIERNYDNIVATELDKMLNKI